MNVILLSGGSGKRLWPLSNDIRSKQFIKIFKNEDGNYESMVQRVYRQIKKVDSDATVTIATSKTQASSIINQLGDDVGISVEPCRRDTFPAIALASVYLYDVVKINLEETVVVCPVDPYVEDDYFEALKGLSQQAEKGEANLVLMGIEPTYPSEKYGYIICEKTNNEVKKVIKFQEKPTLDKAKQLLSEGAYWNAGVFGFKLSYILNILEKNISVNSFEELQSRFSELKKDSFDYEVVEKANSINMIPYSGEWKDLGTWNTLTEEMPSNHGNVITGEENKNVSIVNVEDKPVVVLGLKDVVVVNSTEGVLVSDKGKSSYLKPYVENLNEGRPMFEEKRWGEYKVLEANDFDGIKTLTKHLTIKQGKSISKQLHHKRDEIWTIISGTGELVVDDQTKKVERGDIINIKKEQKHKITAISDLHIIETQIGEELIEEDIERLD